jgi:6-phosphogluconate dehydrogenase
MAQIGFVGLGRKGGNMVARIKRDSDHDVVAYDHQKENVAAAAERGAVAARSLADLVKKLEAPRTIWIMVPAGDPTQDTVDKLAKLLDKDDTIVDGGNSKWTDDKARAKGLRKQGINYVDVGTSGGVWGLDVGYCMMVGGPNRAVKRLSPFLDILAPPPHPEHGPGWGHMGPTGSGHYVKMVHNGIEYGLMQAYAEGFGLFDSAEFELDNAKIAHLWMNGSVVRSWLCELAALAFEQEGNLLEALEPIVAESGEGRWTVEEAVEKRIPMPVITAALFERYNTQARGDYAAKVNAALRAQFGGHAVQRRADG